MLLEVVSVRQANSKNKKGSDKKWYNKVFIPEWTAIRIQYRMKRYNETLPQAVAKLIEKGL